MLQRGELQFGFADHPKTSAAPVTSRGRILLLVVAAPVGICSTLAPPKKRVTDRRPW